MTPDVIALLVLSVIFFFVTYQFGKGYLTAFIIAFYPAYFLFDLVKEKVPSKEPLVIVGLFAVCFLLVLYILKKSIKGGFSFYSSKRLINSSLLTIGAISQFAFVYYYTLPQLGNLYNLSRTLDAFFNGTVPYLVLALFPFVALLITARD